VARLGLKPQGRHRAVAGIADPGEDPAGAGITDAGYSPDAGYSSGLGSLCSRDRWSRRGRPPGPASPMPATVRCRLQPQGRDRAVAGIADPGEDPGEIVALPAGSWGAKQSQKFF